MGFPFYVYVRHMKFVAIGENHLYQKAYTKGMKTNTGTLTLYCLRDYASYRLQKANPEKKKINRIGLTVTKKLGCAVVRSRVKRILREGYRTVDRDTPIKRGFLIVIVAKEGAKTAKTQQIAADLSYAMRRLGMLEGMPFPEKRQKPASGGGRSQLPKTVPTYKKKPADK